MKTLSFLVTTLILGAYLLLAEGMAEGYEVYYGDYFDQVSYTQYVYRGLDHLPRLSELIGFRFRSLPVAGLYLVIAANYTVVLTYTDRLLRPQFGPAQYFLFHTIAGTLVLLLFHFCAAKWLPGFFSWEPDTWTFLPWLQTMAYFFFATVHTLVMMRPGRRVIRQR